MASKIVCILNLTYIINIWSLYINVKYGAVGTEIVPWNNPQHHVVDITAAIPYMEKDMGELARQTTGKLNALTEEKFIGLVFELAEDMG